MRERSHDKKRTKLGICYYFVAVARLKWRLKNAWHRKKRQRQQCCITFIPWLSASLSLHCPAAACSSSKNRRHQLLCVPDAGSTHDTCLWPSFICIAHSRFCLSSTSVVIHSATGASVRTSQLMLSWAEFNGIMTTTMVNGRSARHRHWR